MILTGLLGMMFLQHALANGQTSSITEASNEFAFKMYQILSKGRGNILVCPFSLYASLGLVLQGAKGETAQELRNVLKLDHDNSDIREDLKGSLLGLQDEVLKSVTKLYSKKGYQLYENFTDLARDVFQYEVEALDYSNPITAANTINKYVYENTNNKIINFINEDVIKSDTRFIAVNAVHFNAQWKKPFNTPYKSSFRLSFTKNVPIELMTQRDLFYYKKDSYLDAQLLKLDDKGDYKMIFILPNGNNKTPDYRLLLKSLENKLANSRPDIIFNGFEKQNVLVTIPKFKMQIPIDLKDYLKSMGIHQLFTEDADLSGIAQGGHLKVDQVFQKTYIKVNEEGTQAAAVTGIVGGGAISGFKSIIVNFFKADRPFIFYLVKEKKTNTTILFTGRFEDAI